jgi:hypothetical protein
LTRARRKNPEQLIAQFPAILDRYEHGTEERTLEQYVRALDRSTGGGPASIEGPLVLPEGYTETGATSGERIERRPDRNIVYDANGDVGRLEGRLSPGRMGEYVFYPGSKLREDGSVQGQMQVVDEDGERRLYDPDGNLLLSENASGVTWYRPGADGDNAQDFKTFDILAGILTGYAGAAGKTFELNPGIGGGLRWWDLGTLRALLDRDRLYILNTLGGGGLSTTYDGEGVKMKGMAGGVEALMTQYVYDRWFLYSGADLRAFLDTNYQASGDVLFSLQTTSGTQGDRVAVRVPASPNTPATFDLLSTLLRIRRGGAANTAFQVQIAGEAFPRAEMDASGRLFLGNGTYNAVTGGHFVRLNGADVELSTQYTEPWIAAPTLQNGWASVAGHAVRYYRSADGEVELSGLVQGGTVAGDTTGTIFTLPSVPAGQPKYRPDREENGVTVSNSGGTMVLSRYRILPTGEVIAANGTGATWFSLNNISFRAAS